MKNNNYKATLKKVREEDQEGKERVFYNVDTLTIHKSDLEEGNVEVTWTADDTEFEIWFPKARNPLSMFCLLRWLPVKSRSMNVRKTIRKNVSPGVYEYSIYCKSTQNMAEGHSSPKMIIR